MKQYLALFIALTLISPLAMAQEGDSERTRYQVVDRTEVIDGQTVRIQERIQVTADGISERLASEIDNRRRVMAEEQRQAALQRYEDARERYEQHKAEHALHKQEFQQLRNEWRECEEDCEGLRTQMQQAVRKSLQGAIDALNAHIDRWEERAEASESLTQEEVDAIKARLTTLRNKANEQWQIAENAETGEDIAGIARELGALFREAASETRIIQARHEGQRVMMALLNAERSQERLECTAAAGANLELREHQARVAEARTLMEQARNMYSEGDHEAARQTLNQATEKLYDAAREQQNLALQVREQARSIADCAVPDYDEDFTDENLEEELADEEVE